MSRAAALVVVRPGATRCEMLIHYEQNHVKWGSFSGKVEPQDAGARDTALREFEEEWRLATGSTLPASTVTALRSGIFHEFQVAPCKMACFVVVAPPALQEATQSLVGSTLKWVAIDCIPRASRFPLQMQASHLKKQWSVLAGALGTGGQDDQNCNCTGTHHQTPGHPAAEANPAAFPF